LPRASTAPLSILLSYIKWSAPPCHVAAHSLRKAISKIWSYTYVSSPSHYSPYVARGFLRTLISIRKCSLRNPTVSSCYQRMSHSWIRNLNQTGYDPANPHRPTPSGHGPVLSVIIRGMRIGQPPTLNPTIPQSLNRSIASHHPFENQTEVAFRPQNVKSEAYAPYIHRYRSVAVSHAFSQITTFGNLSV
jgi:hypothetical protein